MAEELMTKPRRKSAVRKPRRKAAVAVVDTEPIEKMKNPLISKSPARTSRFDAQPMLRLMTGVVLLLGGVVLLAGLTGCKKDPQQAVDSMLQVMMSDKIKTVSVTGSINVDLVAKGQLKPTPEIGDQIKITADYSEKMDMNDWNKMKDWLDLNLGLADNKGNEVKGSVESFEDAKILYLKVKDVQGKGLMAIPAEAMTAIRNSGIFNQWIKIDVEQLMKQYGVSSVPVPSTDGEKLKQLFEKYRTKRLLIVSKDLGTKTVDGKKMFSYKVKVDQTQVEEFIQDYLKANNISAQQAGLTPETKKLLMDSIVALNENGIEILVGQKDSYLYGLKLSMPFSYPEASGTVTVQQSYFDYNTTEALKAPTTFKTIEELIGSFMMMMGAPTTTPQGSLPTKDMMDQMKTPGMMQGDMEDLMKTVPSGR